MEYPEYDARMGMLALLHDLYKQALTEGTARHGKLWLEYYPSEGGDRPTRLQAHDPRLDIAEKLGISGDEAYGRLTDLNEDGYLRLGTGEYMFGVSFTEKGQAAIRKLPDPHKLLLAALNELVAAFDGLDNVDPIEREEAKEGAKRVEALLTKLPDRDAGTASSRLANILGLGNTGS
jgi:hypothetical protein